MRLLLITLVFFAVPVLATPWAVGTAFDIESGEVVYFEHHYQSPEGRIKEVVYKNVGDRLVASKKVSYPCGPYRPSILQQEPQLGRVIVVECAAGEVAITRRKSERGLVGQKTFDEQQVAVVDLGFDAYIRDNWQILNSGETLTFDFAFPASLRLVRLQAKVIGRSEEGNLRILVEPANRFIRLLADPINLTYDSEGNHLLQFVGLSNLVDPYGDPLKVRIDYQYRSSVDPG